MKKILLVFTIILIAFNLTSCLSVVDLNQRVLVQAIGIDKVDNNSIKITFQIFSPTNQSGSGVGASSDNAKVIDATGTTIAEAFQNATLKQGKQLFIGHNRLIIISQELAKEGLSQQLSFFSSNPASSQNIHLLIAEDKASDIVSAKINEGILPAETLEEMVKNSSKNGFTEPIKLYQYLKSIENKHESAILPLIKMTNKNEESDKTTAASAEAGDKKQSGSNDKIDTVSNVTLDGMALFSQDKMVAHFNQDESRGILFIRDTIDKTLIVASTDKYTSASLEVFNIKSKLIPSISDGKVSFELKIKGDASITEFIMNSSAVIPDDIIVLQESVEKIIENECINSFNLAIKKYSSDIFNFGNILWQRDVNLFKTLKDNWQDEIKNIDMTVNANIRINRLGLEFKL